MLMFWNIIKNPSSEPETFSQSVLHGVDVRDIADAHIEALLRPQASGHRFLLGPCEPL